MQPDPTMIMLDQLVRILLMEGLKAIVWGPVLYAAFRWGRAHKA